eukprot:6761257-Prymnesium_polylepis.1
MRSAGLACTLLATASAFQPLAPAASARRTLRRAGSPVCMRIQIGDTVIANSDVPEYSIVRAQSYELQRVYYQGVVDGAVDRVDVDSLEAAAPAGCEGFTKYLVLFSARYHAESGPVVVRPNEVEVVTVRDEVADSAWLALPGLFWVWVCYTFYQYGVETGRL